MAMKRLLTETEKQVVRSQQVGQDGSLRCFISGDVIGEGDEIEYDHIQPWSKDGDTSVANMRITLKGLNRRKSGQSLYDVRDNLRLERLFEAKQNDIRLQDIFNLKDVVGRSIHASVNGSTVKVDDGQAPLEFPLFYDAILGVPYFYGRIPIPWIENDDQEGLQPRVIDFKRLIAIRDHLKTHPQLAPSIGRLIGGRLKLFDGQHKLAAQVLNNQADVDIKVYVSPADTEAGKRLFDSLMITNLDAHSKLKQIPFYTSTMLARLSVIHREYLDEFIVERAPDTHSEVNFISFLVARKALSQSEAKDILRGAIRNSALGASNLQTYIAKASKDASYPITVDLMSKTIFRSTLNLEPSNARFNSEDDHRSTETANFTIVADLLVCETGLSNWVSNTKGKSLTNEQLKARRIWHKGSVLTWSPYLKSIPIFALHIMTNAERDAMLYRPLITEKEKEIIRVCLSRLFSHPMWDAPEPEIDSLLVSAQKQDLLFDSKGFTEKYVISGA